MIAEASVVEADLAAGRLCCPVCEEPLSPWGFARERTVRLLDGTLMRGCDEVLLPAWAVARRRDGAEVIGRALLAKANEQGHRTIAAQLRRPPGTVRGWLRTFARRAEPVASSARRWTHALDASADDAIAPGSLIVDAVDALGIAARACPAAARAQRLAVGARCCAHRPAVRGWIRCADTSLELPDRCWCAQTAQGYRPATGRVPAVLVAHRHHPVRTSTIAVSVNLNGPVKTMDWETETLRRPAKDTPCAWWTTVCSAYTPPPRTPRPPVR